MVRFVLLRLFAATVDVRKVRECASATVVQSRWSCNCVLDDPFWLGCCCFPYASHDGFRPAIAGIVAHYAAAMVAKQVVDAVVVLVLYSNVEFILMSISTPPLPWGWAGQVCSPKWSQLEARMLQLSHMLVSRWSAPKAARMCSSDTLLLLVVCRCC